MSQDFIEIVGGTPLRGTIAVSGAKNAALPLLIAALLSPERVNFTNVPLLEDIGILLQLLEQLGATTERNGRSVSITVPSLTATEASYSLVKALRASFWVLAPLLARGGAARVALPGGDIIGARPVDIHLEALTQMGAEISVKHGIVLASAPRGLKAADIDFRFPSVGATHQIIMAAALTPGTTVIRGAAREPEIVALAEMINTLGGDVEGAGNSTVVVRGVEQLTGGDIAIVGDRIEAATYLLAGVASGGSVQVTGIEPAFFGAFMDLLDQLGVGVEVGTNCVTATAKSRLRPVRVSTAPFPGFATDIQAPLVAALSLAEGESSVEETMFEGRFAHVSELCRMGAQIQVDGRFAKISGVERLTAAPVEGHDIRAAAALVLAGVCAEGTTQLFEPQHLRRGYDSLEQKFTSLGAKIGYRVTDPEDYLFTGC